MPGLFAFLPNVRTRLAADAVAAAGARLSLSYDLTITGDGVAKSPSIAVSADLRGPGDVIALNTAQIARVEPEPGLRGFEPNYFPFIEFVDPDFPWRYSLDAGEASKLTPWLALIALKPGEFEFAAQGSSPLPRIRVANVSASLPDLSQSWAFAHVQVNLPEDGSMNAEQALASDPASGFARIFCCRKLDARSVYFLFLVPAYKAGVIAGLDSGEVAEPANALAWTAGVAAAIDLPFYYQTRFSTDAQEDVELLLRRLRGLKADEAGEAGAPNRASAARPGYYLDYSKPGASFELQGALSQPGKTPEAFNTDTALAARMKITLEEAIHGETVGDDTEDPLVTFPAYGFRFRQEKGVELLRARQNQWFDRVNLDLKMRQSAAMGAETVRRNQELFAKLCWDQYEDVIEANLRLSRLQAARELVSRVTRKHLRKLSPDVALTLAEPIQPYVATKTGTVLTDALRNGGASTAFASRGIRRLAAKRPLRSPRTPTAPGKAIPTPCIPGDKTPGAVSTSRLNAPKISRLSSVLAATGLGGQFGIELSQLLGASAFKTQKRPRSSAVRIVEFESREFAAAISDTVLILPGAKADSAVGGRTENEKKAIAPIFRSPEVPLPLSDFLTSFSRNTILSGVSKLPDNTVAFFEENRHFIEAFMVGANHAMNDELRWREFPTDMRGSIFRRFWNRALPPGDVSGDDIPEIHTWAAKLGQNNAPSNADGQPYLVVVIRGDIIRKLGQPIVVINEAEGAKWTSGTGVDHEPVFFGRIGREIAYYGFDVSRSYILSDAVKDRAFFVIYEPMGRLRFGLDVGSASVRAQRQNYLELSLPFPVSAVGKSYQQIRTKQPGSGAAAPAKPADWSDLSWSHMRLTTGSYVRFDRTISISGKDDLWGIQRSSATLARSFWQKPVAAVMPLKRIL